MTENALREAAGGILRNIAAERPLVHCITNYVTVNDCANALLAAGARPVMSHAPQEAADILCAEVPELNAALVAQSQAYLSEQYQADASTWGVIDGTRWSRFFQWLNDNKLVEKQLDVNAGWTMDYLA